MRNIHAVAYTPSLKDGKEQTVHIDVDAIVMINEPKTGFSSIDGKWGTFTSFHVTFDFRESLSIICRDAGLLGFEDAKSRAESVDEVILASNIHIQNVFEKLYEAWAGKMYVKGGKR